MYRSIFFKQYLSSTNFAEVESEEIFNNPIRIHSKIEKVLPKNFDARIIDLGCGIGSFLNTLQKKGYNNLCGVELGEEQTQFLLKKKIKVYKEDIISFLNNSKERFDLITLFDVLEHFNKNEIVELIPLFKDRLSETGTLIVRVPNGEAIFKGSIMYGDFTHETFFTKTSIIQVFRTFGYQNVDIYPVYNLSNSYRARINMVFFKFYARIYKKLLSIDNNSSARNFIPTQNLLGIITK